MNKTNSNKTPGIPRRQFLTRSAGALAVGGSLEVAKASPASRTAENVKARYTFSGADSLCHGPDWETLNPGYWQIHDGALRRRLNNVGDRARRTGFPFHSATKGAVMQTEYDPSQPAGILYRRDWNLHGTFVVSAKFVVRGSRPTPPAGDDPRWQMYQDGYGTLGLALGAKSLFESHGKIRHAIQAVWSDDQRFRFIGPGARSTKGGRSGRQANAEGPDLRPGDEVQIQLQVTELSSDTAQVTATLSTGEHTVTISEKFPLQAVAGYVGIAGRGLVDFEVSEFEVEAPADQRLSPRPVECFTCYPLGDSLAQVDGQWQVRFVSLFATDGQNAEIRIATTPIPQGGWKNVPVAGSAAIVNHTWRRNTAVIHTTLPANPADSTMYYTVWKDGENVTADPRVGSDSTGPGTGMVGDVPSRGDYVGRLPQLKAPYKLCGLSCHAITGGLQQSTENGLRILGGNSEWQFRDQPTQGAYQHLEEYNFQILVWEDDVWYMELVLYPPSTDDAYQVVKNSICGPTSRWQMMRHWNIINPGDHDYGMDDVKGPEQLAIRRVPGLGQDCEYMKRNFQIVHHLVTGAEEVDPLANPKKWRAWKMPNRDFTLVILDSRLWRSSQDVDMWDDAGWGEFKSLYDRTDPTRSLLGEEQFGWLQELLATDASRLICVTGINGMHTVWGPTDQRNRVMADYAGWVKAGTDRVLELLGSREGVVTVYGDVHNGCIMKNTEHGVIECSFGPIGRSGGRSVIPGFGRRMNDFDGRRLEVSALYHKTHADPDLQKHAVGDPFYWNFLEMEFDPRPREATIGLRIRNMVDAPQTPPRGGGALETTALQTGRTISCRLPVDLVTLPHADVRFVLTDGRPVRGIRSLADGRLPLVGLADIPTGTKLIVTAFDSEKTQSQLIETLALEG